MDDKNRISSLFYTIYITVHSARKWVKRTRLSFLRDGRMGMKRNRGEWRRKKPYKLRRIIKTYFNELTNTWYTHNTRPEKKSLPATRKNFNTRRPPYIRHITYYYNVRVAIDVVACTCSCPAITKSPDGPAGIFFLSFRWYSRLLRRRYGDFNDLNKQTANASSTTPSCINDTNYLC